MQSRRRSPRIAGSVVSSPNPGRFQARRRRQYTDQEIRSASRTKAASRSLRGDLWFGRSLALRDSLSISWTPRCLTIPCHNAIAEARPKSSMQGVSHVPEFIGITHDIDGDDAAILNFQGSRLENVAPLDGDEVPRRMEWLGWQGCFRLQSKETSSRYPKFRGGVLFCIAFRHTPFESGAAHPRRLTNA